MGSLYDKAGRLQTLTAAIGADWGFTDEELVNRLYSEMVEIFDSDTLSRRIRHR